MMSTETGSRTGELPDLDFGSELPGRGLPANDQPNEQLFDESQIRSGANNAAPNKHRIWPSGEVALEPVVSSMQNRPFANWGRSRLSYHVGSEPPDGYTGLRIGSKKDSGHR